MTKLSDMALNGLQFDLGAKAYLDMSADHLKVDAVFETGEGFECVMKLSFGKDITVEMMKVIGPSKEGFAPYATLAEPSRIPLENWTRTLRTLSQELEDQLCRDIGHKSERMLQQEAIDRITKEKEERSQYMEAFCEHYLRVHPGYDRQINSFNSDGTFSNAATDWEFLAFIAGAKSVGIPKVDADPLLSPVAPYFISADTLAADFTKQLANSTLAGYWSKEKIAAVSNWQNDLNPEHIRIDVEGNRSYFGRNASVTLVYLPLNLHIEARAGRSEHLNRDTCHRYLKLALGTIVGTTVKNNRGGFNK